jgi:hypothetical protein
MGGAGDITVQITNAKLVGDYNNARIILDTAASHASPAPPPAPQAKPKP